jgi:hypothetical protein
MIMAIIRFLNYAISILFTLSIRYASVNLANLSSSKSKLLAFKPTI